MSNLIDHYDLTVCKNDIEISLNLLSNKLVDTLIDIQKYEQNTKNEIKRLDKMISTVSANSERYNIIVNDKIKILGKGLFITSIFIALLYYF